MRGRTSWISAALTVSVFALAGVGTGLVPMAATADEVHFTAVGDYAAGANTSAVLNRIDALGPDLNLALGDLSYASSPSEDAWCEYVTSHVGAGFAFQLLAGNHESNGMDGNINDFSACLPNQLPGLVGTYGRQWYVDVPAHAPLVRYVMISPALTFPDGTWSYAVGSPRYQWTAAAIDGARAASIPWVVVGAHKPCLSVGVYGCDIGAGLHDMLIAKKVDLVLYGHEHSYQRTHQIGFGPGCSTVVPGTFNASCVVDSTAEMGKSAGTVFATVGTGGIAQRAVDPADSEAGYFAAMSGLATATWGALDVRLTPTTLTASFERASGGTFTDAFTIGPPVDPPPNQSPTASFTASCSGLACAVDANASTDPDGVIASYAWTMGDGTSLTGAGLTHTYAAPGTYTITLTVTDDDGATGTVTRTVEVSEVVEPVAFAADTFSRTVATGFGSAETGGLWRTTGSSANYSVSGGVGRIILPASGAGPDISLPAVSSSSTDLTYTIATDKPIVGSGLYVSVSPRRLSTGSYSARLQLRPDASIVLALERKIGSTATLIAPAAVLPGVTHVAGEQLKVRVQATGTSPTTIQAKVWRAGTAEPSAWTVTRTDSATELQASGWIGVSHYLSSGATNTPIVLTVDDLLARPVG
ncbi:PKD domain-containing protein [Actinotalea sp. K2]|uniref:PKD domain-containing protein n=1 Tax=Actinotalea sp. K2 TaxID=2939438 RepID=UPI00201762DA|nr:PKD domain-containing protein [Actinotalea sp. K2]MCL3859613.1 PKD domain-containing protein [Actinotalea sp. K2]